ncbi:MAG: hypothetical protein IKX06_04840 [Clostridia bacterium]|nr:hypothetical protein [Clostridia bacterium]
MFYSLSNGNFRFNARDLLFDPCKTFDCGQCFHWDRGEDGSYVGVVFGKALKLLWDPEDTGDVIIRDLSGRPIDRSFAEKLCAYLDLDHDYVEALSVLSSKDPVMKEAVISASGIHLLRQDLFETAISFIISANNNIPRIKKCIGKLSELFGKPIVSSNGRILGFAFPEPCALAAALPAELREKVRVGYRAEYIVKTAGAFTDGSFSCDTVFGSREDEVRKMLAALPGVGPKVASCIMLFAGLSREAFPVDVWVERLMKEFYGLDGMSRQAIEKHGRAYFGEYAGLAQQLLFYYKRYLHS